MARDTNAQRRIAHEQALASTQLEGHVPTTAFLADGEAVIAGAMTPEHARAASLARALAAEQEAARRDGVSDGADGA